MEKASTMSLPKFKGMLDQNNHSLLNKLQLSLTIFQSSPRKSQIKIFLSTSTKANGLKVIFKKAPSKTPTSNTKAIYLIENLTAKENYSLNSIISPTKESFNKANFMEEIAIIHWKQMNIRIMVDFLKGKNKDMGF